jgi:hypothetical protein
MFPKNTVADNVPEATLYSIRNAQVMLRNGFTTLRDVGGGATPITLRKIRSTKPR